MNKPQQSSYDFSLAYYIGDRKTGSVFVVDRKAGQTQVTALPTGAETGLEKQFKPVFIGLTEDRQFILMDPKSAESSISTDFPADAFPAHIYPDTYSNRDWFMNDGDKETGNDTVNCGDKGSSVTVVEDTASTTAKFLGTTCVGRGHHQATFSAPSDRVPGAPKQAYISNLNDGTISVLGNDPENEKTFLTVLGTINLCEPEKEDSGEMAIPNNAFPHGLVYSSYSGKLYNLNNGYGTIAVIDPQSREIEQRIPFKGHSNLFVSPCGRYIIGRGADRKSDANHVVGKLTVLDLDSHTITDQADLMDVYISKYYFNSEGSKLYLTTGKSGSPEQLENLKQGILLVFDMTALPKIKLLKEVDVGISGSLDFLSDAGKTQLVFSSNADKGALVIVDGNDETVLESVHVTDSASHSRLWMLN